MDYKYIEQLLQRYWDCETSREEEQILRAFFAQRDLPAGLARYRDLFVYEQEQACLQPGADFDRRVLAAIGEAGTEAPQPVRVVKAGRVTLSHRLRPLYRAAAAVAVVTLLGVAAQHSLFTQPGNAPAWDYNQAAYKDSYQDPEKAYEAGMKALEMFKQGPKTAAADSMVRGRHVQAPQPAEKD